MYSSRLDFKEKYNPNFESFQLEVREDFNYQYNWTDNKFTKYYLEDTITITNALSKTEQSEIFTLIKNYNLFNLDSIYRVGDEIAISSHNSNYKLAISDKNKKRIFDIDTMLAYNKLSNKNDYNTFIKAYLEIIEIVNNSKSVQSIPESDLN